MRALLSVDRAFEEILSTSVACNLELFHRYYMFGVLRRVPSAGPDSPRNLLTMAGRSLLEVATKAWEKVPAQAYVFLISVRLIFAIPACAKVEAFWASSGAPRVRNLRAVFFFA